MCDRFQDTDGHDQYISEVSGDAQIAHQAAADSVLHLWKKKKARERSEAEERRRKGSIETIDAQQVEGFFIRRHPHATTIRPVLFQTLCHGHAVTKNASPKNMSCLCMIIMCAGCARSSTGIS